jgi:hypothetical protein
MKQNKIIWLVAIFLVFAISVVPKSCYAFGIAPSSIDIAFEAGLEKTISIKILNTEEDTFSAMVYAEGELAEYVTINDPVVDFSGELEKIITVTLKLPEKIGEPGEHEAKIIVRKIPSKETSQGTNIQTNLAVGFKLKVMVPYPWKYASARLFAPYFKANEESNFAVEITNLGEKTIFATAIIDILSPLNEKIDTLKSEEVTIEPKEKSIVTIKWKPEALGSYYAKTNVIYNEHEADDERAFSIGEVLIDVSSISVDKFSLGGIAKFNILLENKWNERIPGVYADVAVTDESGKQYAISKTASKDIEAFGRQELEVFWETKGIEKGRYKLNIVLNYLGAKSEKQFDIDVGLDKIDVIPFGGHIVAVGGEAQGGVESYINILIILILVVIGINIFIYIKVVKKRSQ